MTDEKELLELRKEVLDREIQLETLKKQNSCDHSQSGAWTTGVPITCEKCGAYF